MPGAFCATLVELIIVIAIMAILVAVLAPQYMRYVDRSRYSSDVQMIDGLYTVVQAAASDPQNPVGAVTITWSKNGDKIVPDLPAAAGGEGTNAALIAALKESYGNSYTADQFALKAKCWTDSEKNKDDKKMYALIWVADDGLSYKYVSDYDGKAPSGAPTLPTGAKGTNESGT